MATETCLKRKSSTFPAQHKTFFHLIYSFGKNKSITNFVNVWMLEDLIQMVTTITCGPFQLYFYKNVFFPDKSKLENYKKLTNIALETLLNELLH